MNQKIKKSILNLIVQIRNAMLNKSFFAVVPYTKLAHQIVNILVNQSFILEVSIFETLVRTKNTVKKKKMLFLHLNYYFDSTFDDFYYYFQKMIPGHKCIYSKMTKIRDLEKYMKKDVFFILSTNKGYITNKEALSYNVGGHIILYLM